MGPEVEDCDVYRSGNVPLKVLALDFDGVISDSALESFVVALRTYEAFDAEGALSEVSANLRNAPSGVIRSHPLFLGFVDLMPLGNRAEDMGLALKCLSVGKAISDQAEWDVFRDQTPVDFLTGFHERFYQEREILRNQDFDEWLALLAPFGLFVEFLRRRQNDCVLALATAKDRPSVDLLLDAYSISHIFMPSRIIDKEAGRSKQAHLGLLQERLDVAFEDITFVDDKLNHLEDVSKLGVRGVLAGWGYNGERERRLAMHRGFLVCELETADAQLFGAPGGEFRA